MNRPMTIGVDFDGTIVEHAYPEIGKPVPNAIETLKLLQSNQHRLMLWTMRSGKELVEAVLYLESHGIKLWGINENPQQKSWTQSTKQFAHVYIDDAALGCPLVYTNISRPYVDWDEVKTLLYNMGLLL